MEIVVSNTDVTTGSPEPSLKVLQDQDLLLIIFSFLDPDAFFGSIWDLESSTRRDLRSAALTCRAFFSPASTLLWRMMKSLLPILKLLPAFVLVGGIYTINDTILSKDLQALERYNEKVRYLYLGNFNDQIRAHAILRLATMKGSILPNLRSIYIPSFGYTNGSVDNTSALFLAYSDSLTTLYIDGIVPGSMEETIASYLSTLQQKDSPIQDIVLGGSLTGHTLKFLASFSRLKSLNLTLKNTRSLTPSILSSWTDLASLTHLVIDMDRSCAFGHTEHLELLYSSLNFRRLQVLRLEGLPSQILSIMRTICRSENLSTIKLSSHFGTNPDAVRAADLLLNCVRECVRMCRSLKVFALQVARNQLEGRTVLSERTLSSLYGCKELEILHIGDIYLPINDNTIRELANTSHWSNIQFLHLPSTCDSDNCPSLLSLGVISRNFPNIIELQIPVNFRLCDYESLARERTMTPRSPHGLKTILLLNVRPGQTLEFATGTTYNLLSTKMAIGVSRFIEHYFPRLETIKLIHWPWVRGLGLDDSWWDGVVAAIFEYRALREETLLLSGEV